MFCPNCGTKNRDGARFCTNCASALTAPPPPANVSGSEGGQTQLYPPGYLSGAGVQEAPAYREQAQYGPQEAAGYAPPAGQQYPYNGSNQQPPSGGWGSPVAATPPYQHGYPATPAYPPVAPASGIGISVKQVLGFIGVVALVVGDFLPILKDSFTSFAMWDARNDGKFLLGCALVAALLVLASGIRSLPRALKITLQVLIGVAAALAAYVLIVDIHDVYDHGDQSFISWPGWIVMFAGVALLLASIAVPMRSGRSQLSGSPIAR